MAEAAESQPPNVVQRLCYVHGHIFHCNLTMSKSRPTQHSQVTPGQEATVKFSFDSLSQSHFLWEIFHFTHSKMQHKRAFRALTLGMQQCKYFIATLQIQLEFPLSSRNRVLIILCNSMHQPYERPCLHFSCLRVMHYIFYKYPLFPVRHGLTSEKHHH